MYSGNYWIELPPPGLAMLIFILSIIAALYCFIYAVRPETRLRRRPDYGIAFGIWSGVAIFFGHLLAAYLQLS